MKRWTGFPPSRDYLLKGAQDQIRKDFAAFITDANPANGPQDLLWLFPDITNPHEQALVLNMLADAVDSDPAICRAIMASGASPIPPDVFARKTVEMKSLIRQGVVVRFGGL